MCMICTCPYAIYSKSINKNVHHMNGYNDIYYIYIDVVVFDDTIIVFNIVSDQKWLVSCHNARSLGTIQWRHLVPSAAISLSRCTNQVASSTR